MSTKTDLKILRSHEAATYKEEWREELKRGRGKGVQNNGASICSHSGPSEVYSQSHLYACVYCELNSGNHL
jgi:hypothetical protein